MTSRDMTGFLPLREEGESAAPGSTWRSRLPVVAYGAISWPFLLVSLWGGTKASKRRLLARLNMADDALPNLGSWKADTGFLHRIVDAVEELRPRNVVELGAGASSLVCARALQMHGGGILHSYDQHAGFVELTAEWLRDEGLDAQIRYAPLEPSPGGWPGRWYALSDLPETIDLLIIDGPPWAIHPHVRGAAEVLFDRLSPGAIVLLDDAARPGERVVARRWSANWPGIAFARAGGSTKGTLIGRKLPSADVLPFRARLQAETRSRWQRAAAALALLATGWLGNDLAGDLAQPVQAASFIDEADASAEASLMRQQMTLQAATIVLDRAEIRRTTGLELPALPTGWTVADIQLFPSEQGMALTLSLVSPHGQSMALFATRAETPAERLPLLDRREGRSLAYWEAGPFAYALSGEQVPAIVLSHAAELAH